MNLLDLIPGISQILDKVVTSPKEKMELESKLKELDIRELEAKAQVQASWLSNKSLFVSGAIPSILWMMVLVIFFNFIISPIAASFGYKMPILDLPPWYADLCGTIVLGLFAKKAWDSTDMSLGNINKKSKYESEAETTYNMSVKPTAIEESKPIETVVTKKEERAKTSTINTKKNNVKKESINKEVALKDDKEVAIEESKPNYDDPEYINARLEQMYADMNLKNP